MIGEVADAVLPARTTAEGTPSLFHSRGHRRLCCSWSDRMKSHLLEWLLTLIVLIVPLACAFFFIPFRERAISLLDAAIQQPYFENDSLPILSVVIPSILVPVLLFFLYPYLLSKYSHRFGLPPHKYSLHLTYWWSSCLIQSIGVTVVLSELSKRLVQAPRPDFMHRCFPDGIPDAVMTAAKDANYIVNTILCTPRTKAIFDDGLQSMPSEHTSIAWTLMTVLILYFHSLRRELVAHSIRNARRFRAEKRTALVERLIATGIPLERAQAMTSGTCAPSTSSELKNKLNIGAAGDGKPLVRPAPSPSPSPEMRPPVLLGEPDNADLVPEGPLQDEVCSPVVADGCGVEVNEATARAPRRPRALAAHPASAPGPRDSGVVSNGQREPREMTPAEQRKGRQNNTRDRAPAPAYWPNSHVVYIAHVLGPFGWAVSVGLSRTFDHRHAFLDVVAGALLGTAVAFAVYKMHLVKFQGYHARWNKEQECEEMDLEAARGSDARHRQRRAEAARGGGSTGNFRHRDGTLESSLVDSHYGLGVYGSGGASSPFPLMATPDASSVLRGSSEECAAQGRQYPQYQQTHQLSVPAFRINYPSASEDGRGGGSVGLHHLRPAASSSPAALVPSPFEADLEQSRYTEQQREDTRLAHALANAIQLDEQQVQPQQQHKRSLPAPSPQVAAPGLVGSDTQGVQVEPPTRKTSQDHSSGGSNESSSSQGQRRTHSR